MTDTAQLFEITNIKRFRRFWATCEANEQAEIYKIIRVEMGDEVEEKLSKKQLNIQASEVLEFLNLKANKTFRPVDTHLKTIRARLQSGITVQELKAIIAMKTRDWKGSDYEDKLRPKTLFTETNCENYLGELT